MSVRDGAGVYIEGNKTPEGDVSHLLGVSGATALKLFRYVCREDFVRASHQSDLSRSYSIVWIENISTFGLLEIGKLPDPKARLLSGLEAALRNVQQDPTLRPEEKEQKLNAGREAIAFIRSLAVEVAAKVLVG